MSAELDKHMKKLKDMGVTISVSSGSGAEPTGVSALLKQAAEDAGIYHEKGETPGLSAEEKAEVARFGIHDEGPGLPEVTYE